MGADYRADRNASSQSLAPAISIIIPTYNVAPYIARCLRSCVNQSFENIEILIIDDCGSDDSIAIAREFAKDDPRINIIHNPKNLGTFHARARGIESARGAYCMFADPDDFLDLHACELALEAITREGVDVVHFGMSYEPRTLMRIAPIVHRGRLEGDCMRLFLSGGNNTQGLWDKLYPTHILRLALQKLSFIEPPLLMLEDGLLVLVASLESQSYFGLPTPLYRYCFNPNSITKDKSSARFRKKQQELDKMLSITHTLLELYPQHTRLLTIYRRKIASTLLIESRHYTLPDLAFSLQILERHSLCLPSKSHTYFECALLSLRYAFRWQNLVRLLSFALTFGRLRL